MVDNNRRIDDSHGKPEGRRVHAGSDNDDGLGGQHANPDEQNIRGDGRATINDLGSEIPMGATAKASGRHGYAPEGTLTERSHGGKE